MNGASIKNKFKNILIVLLVISTLLSWFYAGIVKDEAEITEAQLAFCSEDKDLIHFTNPDVLLNIYENRNELVEQMEASAARELQLRANRH